MSMPSPNFTNAGRILQLKCMNGDTMRLDQAYIVLGDGELTTQAPQTLNAVVHEVMRIPVTRIRRTGDHVILGGYTNFSDLTVGFYWRELAVYIPDLDGGLVAYCYANAFDQADYIDPAVNTLERMLTVGIIVGDAASVNVDLDESLVILTQTDKGVPGGVAPLDEGGQVPDPYIADNIPRMRPIASRLRDPAKPDYGLGGGAAEAEAEAVLILRDYTGTAEATAVLSGQEYDALNISTGGDAIPDGTIILNKQEE